MNLQEQHIEHIITALYNHVIRLEKNTETDIELYFNIDGFKVHLTGFYVNVGYVEQTTGTFINKTSKVSIYELEVDSDTVSYHLIRDITKRVNSELICCI